MKPNQEITSLLKGINMKKTLDVISTAVAIGALVLLSALPLPAETKNTKTEPNAVKIDNFSFTPQTLTVRTGTKVTWTNKDDVPHTVTSTDKKFKSGVLDTDDQFSFTFSAPGTYSYFCSVHPHMTGKIVVQ